MSQKVNSKGFRLGEKTSFQTWESIWFSDPKKGKQNYSQLFHEDLILKEYIKGFFRSFQFYVDKTIIERKSLLSLAENSNKPLSESSFNNEIIMTTYVYRPNLRLNSSNTPPSSPKEKELHEGLRNGWIPFSILKTVGKSILWRYLIKKGNSSSHSLQTLKKDSFITPSFLSKGINEMSTSPTSKKWGLVEANKMQKGWPSFNTLLSNQDLNSFRKTQENRLSQDWLYSQTFLGLEKKSNAPLSPTGIPSDVSSNISVSNSWWMKRSWESSVVLDGWPSGAIATSLKDLSPHLEHLDGVSHRSPPLPVQGSEVSARIPWTPSTVKIKWNLVPVNSLTNSAQLVADYLSSKIEQSTSIQSLFQEMLFLFNQEAICIGPAFRNNTINRESSTISKTTKQRSGEALSKNTTGSWKGNSKKEELANNNISYENNSWKNMGNSNNVGDKAVIEGFRISCSGRLQMNSRSKPAEKAESVVLNRGVLPLNSFNRNIDFKQTSATNAYGTVGIKVWIHYIYRPGI